MRFPPCLSLLSPRVSFALLVPALVCGLALAGPQTASAQTKPAFNALTTTPTNSSFNFPGAGAVGDFNGDGKLDAIVTDGSANLRLLLGNGDGTFTEHDISVPGENPGTIRAADLNHDGRLDVVFTNNGGTQAVTVLLNTGNDGNGVPQFSITDYAPGFQSPRSITIGDLNGDGYPDLIAGGADDAIQVFLNKGDGTFTPKGNQFSFLPSTGGPAVGQGVIADVNGDGKADYVVITSQANGTGTNIFFGNGDGTFNTASPIMLAGTPLSIATGDLNHDGLPDLVEGTQDGYVKVYLNDGSGTFSTSVSYTTDAAGTTPTYQIYSVALADLNGDGNQDVVATNYFNFVLQDPAKTIAVLVGKGDGTLVEPPSLFTVNAGPTAMSLGDFNGDGKLDIASVDYANRSFDLLLNITKPTLAVSGLSAGNKAYDGTTSATISGSPFLTGVSAADAGNVSVTCTATGSFAQASPGDGIAVSLTAPGCALQGSAASNYQLAQPTFTANIAAPAVQNGAGDINVGQSASILLSSVTFSAPGTLSSISVVTEGAPNLDFTQPAGIGSCVVGSTYSAGQSCTVGYTFTPTAAGQRLGGVVLKDSGGNLLGESFLSGIGQGAVAAYGGASAVAYPTTGQPTIVQLGMDAKGNIFYGNHSGGLSELPANGDGTYAPAQLVIASGMPTSSFLHGGVFDGAGNLYLADNGHGLLYRIPFANGAPGSIQTITGFTDSPQVLAVDVSGNVFAASCCSGNVYMVSPTSLSAAHIATLPSAGSDPEGMVVDASGNLYISGASGSHVLLEVATPTTSPVVSTITVSAGSPFALGMDPNGDIIYSNGTASGSALYRIVNAGGTLNFSAATQVGTADSPRQILFDRNGNMLVTSNKDVVGSDNTVFVLPQQRPIAQNFPATNVGSASGSKSISVTNIGNAVLNFSNLTFDGNFPDQGSTCTVSSSLAVLSSCNFTTVFAPTAGGSLSGSLVITDDAVNESAPQSSLETGIGQSQPQTIAFTLPATVTYAGQTIALNGAATSGLAVSYGVSGPATLNGNSIVITGVGSVTVTASQPGNGAWAAATNVIQSMQVTPAAKTITFLLLTTPVTVNATAALSASASNGDAVVYSVTAGTAAIAGTALTYTNAGSITITASSPATANYTAATPVSQTVTVNPEPVSYAASETAVGQSSPVQVAYVNFTTAGTLGSANVVTQGATGLDFNPGGTDTCLVGHAYTVGQACEVDYVFSPTSPGERQGGIVVKDAGGNLLGVSYLGGLADGPLGLFSSPTATWTATSTGNFATARGLSVDGNGNVYFASTGNPQGLFEIPTGTSNVIQVAAASVGTGATAVDGAGNVYLASANQSKIFELVNGSLVSISPVSFEPDDNLEVDGAGNLYTSDYQTGAIYELAAGTHAVSTIIPGNLGRRFIGIAVDPAGDIFAADFDNHILYEIKAGTHTLTQLAAGSPLNNPHAVALDPAGNVYVGNYGGSDPRILRYAAGTWLETTLPATATRSLIIDGQGNLYGVVSDGKVAKYSRTTSPTAVFPSTVYGATSSAPLVEFENDGNAGLNISSYTAAATANFGTTGTGNTCATGTLDSGATCFIGASFTPTAASGFTGTLTLTDNNLNQANAQQTVNLSGTGTPAPLTITASNGSMGYGGSVPVITPSYSGFVNGDTAASLTAAPTCSTVANASSHPGTYSSSCSGAAGANYTITYNPGTIEVTAATLTITASGGSMTYGGTATAITPSYSGFVNGDSVASLTTAPTCSTSATSTSGAGSYGSSCSGAADANYTIVYVSGSVVVNAAPLIITASGGSMTYGGTLPVITPSYSGFVNGDNAGSLSPAPTCSTKAASNSNVGTYISSCAGASDNNYTISYVAGSVQISAAPLLITASTASMTYGGTLPGITPSYSGFVNGDSAASLAPAPTCSTVATAASHVAGYGSSCSGAADANYTIIYVAGSVQINAAPLLITASSVTMTYGAAVPAITASYGGFVNGDSAASLAPAPACITAATSASIVGGYGSSCSGAADGDYTITYAPGSVQVNAAPLLITASNGSMFYGTAPPAITPAYSGFVAGNTATSLSAQPVCSTLATSASNIGSYGSSCAGAADANYTIGYAPGSVTILPAPQSIVWPTLADQLFNGNPLSISLPAVSGAGLAMNYTVTGAATAACAGGACTLTVTAPGAVTVTGTATANPNYQPASASQSFNVNVGTGWGLYATSNTCGAIRLDGDARIDSYDSALGGYPAGADRIHGGIGTNGNALLVGGATVYGPLYDPHGNTTGDCDHSDGRGNNNAAPVTSLEAHAVASVQGGIVTLPVALTFPAPVIPAGATTAAQVINGTCQNLAGCTVLGGSQDRHVALAPGNYGNLSLGGQVTVDLSAGTYNINSLRIAGGGSLHVVSGPVIVNLAGQSGGDQDRDDQLWAVLAMNGGGVRNAINPSELQFRYAGTFPIHLAGGSDAAMVIYAPNAPVTVNGGPNGFCDGQWDGNNSGDWDDHNFGPWNNSGFGPWNGGDFGFGSDHNGGFGPSNWPGNDPTHHYAGFSGSIVAATIHVNGGAIHYDRELAAQGLPVNGGNGATPLPPPPTVLTVSANSVSAVAGACDGDNDGDDRGCGFGYTVTGFVNGDTAATVIEGQPQISANAPENAKPGTYAINIAQGSLQAAGNYTFQFVPGALTLTAPPPHSGH